MASLAKSYYGHEKFARFLIDSNPQIRDPSRVGVGTIVKIPPAPSDRQVPGAKRHIRTAAARKGTAEPRTYTVQRGDSFYAIASSQLGDASRWQELFALNKDLVHSDPKRLQIGQVLTLPD